MSSGQVLIGALNSVTVDSELALGWSGNGPGIFLVRWVFFFYLVGFGDISLWPFSLPWMGSGGLRAGCVLVQVWYSGRLLIGC